MTHDREIEHDVDALLAAHFAAAKTAVPDPSDAMIARILADAEAVQREFEAPATVVAPASRDGAVGVLQSLGGWPAVAGLSCAMVAGVWIGVAPPDVLAVTAQTVLGAETLSALDPSAELFPSEESL